jgi:LEA14-like dessication related protein
MTPTSTMRPRSLPVLLAASVLALLLAGCGTGGKLGGVNVTVVDVRSAEPALLETKAVVTLRYVNENVVPLGISGSRHKLSINGTAVGQAVSNAAVGLPPLSTATQEVTLLINNLAVVSMLQELSRRPQASYRIESTLFVDAGDDRLDIKTHAEGVVDLSALQGLQAPPR